MPPTPHDRRSHTHLESRCHAGTTACLVSSPSARALGERMGGCDDDRQASTTASALASSVTGVMGFPMGAMDGVDGMGGVGGVGGVGGMGGVEGVICISPESAVRCASSPSHM